MLACSCYFLLVTFIFLKDFISFTDRESMSMGKSRGKGRGKGKESQADSALSAEPTVGLNLMTLRS